MITCDLWYLASIILWKLWILEVKFRCYSRHHKGLMQLNSNNTITVLYTVCCQFLVNVFFDSAVVYIT
jgi:hypothetical protein